MRTETRNKSAEKIDNNCNKCAFGAKHYVNINVMFQSTNCMHCTNGKMTVRAREARIANRVECEYWQPEQIQKEQRKESIEYYLELRQRG